MASSRTGIGNLISNIGGSYVGTPYYDPYSDRLNNNTAEEYKRVTKNEELIIILNTLHQVLELDDTEYKSILNLIMSKDRENLEIAGAMMRNIHKNYNISKK